MKVLISLLFSLISTNVLAASMTITPAQLGLKFENKTGDRELEISSIKPVVTCETIYMGFFGDLKSVSHVQEPRSVHYPVSLHVGTDGLSYVQLNISGTESVHAPDRAFYREKHCEFAISFQALVINDQTGEQMASGTVKIPLMRTDRDNVNVLAELNAMKVMKFKVQANSEGKTEFALENVGVFPLN